MRSSAELDMEKFTMKMRDVIIENKSINPEKCRFVIKSQPLTMIDKRIMIRYSIIVMVEGEQVDREFHLRDAGNVYDFLKSLSVTIDGETISQYYFAGDRTDNDVKYKPTSFEYIAEEDLTVFYFDVTHPLSLLHEIDEDFLTSEEILVKMEVNTERKTVYFEDGRNPIPFTIGLLMFTELLGMLLYHISFVG